MKRTERGSSLRTVLRLILLLILLLGIIALFCYVLFGAEDTSTINEYFRSSLVTSELVYIMLALCAVLPAGLVWLLLIAVRTKKDLRKRKKAVKRKRRSEASPRFSMLDRIDEEMRHYEAPKYDDEITLEELCRRFRNYAASELGLYYDEADIRRFVAGLGVTRLLILQGMSGTGKTSLAYAMGQFLQNDSVVVPIQPMWKERSDMIGYFNEFTKRFNETTMLRKMYEAGYREDLYITVLDEVNISRIEYYFAEFLSLLELPDEDKRYLDVVSDVWENDPARLRDGKIKLPPNMWFVGTANNDDSTFAISDKVYDRAMVLDLERKCHPFRAEKTEGIRLSYTHWSRLIAEAQKKNELSESSAEKLGALDRYLIEHFRISFGNRIMKQIREYVPICVACGGTETEALDDILARKVLRKLETRNPAHVRSEADSLSALLDDLFGENALPQCRESLNKLLKVL